MALKPPPAIINAPGARGSVWTVSRLRTGSRVPIYYEYARLRSEATALDVFEKCLGGEIPE